MNGHSTNQPVHLTILKRNQKMSAIITKEEAIKYNQSTYNDYKKCKHGHIAPKFVHDDSCTKCKANNSEYKSLKNKEYHEQNREKIAQRKQARKKEIAKFCKEYEQKNPRFSSKRRSNGFNVFDVMPKWVDHFEREAITDLLRERDRLNNILKANGTYSATNHFEVDHIIPISPRDKSVTGLHCLNNLQIVHSRINRSKKCQYRKDW